MIIIIYHHNLRINVAVATSPTCTNVDRRGTSGCNKTKAFLTALFCSEAFSGHPVQCSQVTQHSAAVRSEDRQRALAPCSGPANPQRTRSSRGGLTAVTHRWPDPAFKTIFWLQALDLGYVSLMFEELGVPIAQGRAEGGTCKEDLQPFPACAWDPNVHGSGSERWRWTSHALGFFSLAQHLSHRAAHRKQCKNKDVAC